MSRIARSVAHPVARAGAHALTAGVGVPYSAEATALFARFTAPPTTARKALIDALIVSLKSAGVWSKLDALYLLAAADSQAARRNWLADQFNVAEVNAPTFAADRGYAGNGTTSYLDTTFGPSVAGGKFTQDSMSFGIWARTNQQNGAAVAGQPSGATVSVNPRSASDQGQARANESGNQNYGSVANMIGLSAVNRSAAGATQYYKDGAADGTGSGASGAMTATTLSFGNVNGNFSVVQFAGGFIGGSLSIADHSAIFTAMQTYMTGVGA